MPILTVARTRQSPPKRVGAAHQQLTKTAQRTFVGECKGRWRATYSVHKQQSARLVVWRLAAVGTPTPPRALARETIIGWRQMEMMLRARAMP